MCSRTYMYVSESAIVCVWERESVGERVCVWMCMCVRLCASMCLCVCACVYVYVCLNMHVCVRAFVSKIETHPEIDTHSAYAQKEQKRYRNTDIYTDAHKTDKQIVRHTPWHTHRYTQLTCSHTLTLSPRTPTKKDLPPKRPSWASKTYKNKLGKQKLDLLKKDMETSLCELTHLHRGHGYLRETYQWLKETYVHSKETYKRHKRDVHSLERDTQETYIEVCSLERDIQETYTRPICTHKRHTREQMKARTLTYGPRIPSERLTHD